MRRVAWVVLLAVCLLSLREGRGLAADTDGAKAFNEKAMAEFGLGDYAHAAEDYENAFRLKPDGAFLYNAAQSYRLAGNKARALELYRSFVRLFGDKLQTADARRHIAGLEKQIAADAAAGKAGTGAAGTTGTGAAATGAGTAATGAATATASPPATSASASPGRVTAAPSSAAGTNASAGANPSAGGTGGASTAAGASAPAALPSLTPEAASAATATAAGTPADSSSSSSQATVGSVTTTAPPRERSRSNLIVWIAIIGGVLLVAGGAAFWVSQNPSYPDPSLGKGSWN